MCIRDSGAGALAGLVTGLIYTKGKVPILLAGILTMTAVYSINLRIMGQANRSLLGKGTLFSADFLDFLPKNFPTVVVLSLIHISEPTRRTPISYAVFCLKKKKKNNRNPVLHNSA